MKRPFLIVPIVALAVAPLAPTPARADEVPDGPTCTQEHLSGDDCQGPDVNPDPAWCKVKVWVGRASCTIVAPDGAVNSMGLGAAAWADEGVMPEFDVVIRDASTGAVLSQTHLEGEPADCNPEDFVGYLTPPNPSFLHDQLTRECAGQTNTSAGMSIPGNAAAVTCEITGTHTRLGATTAAFGETPDVEVPLVGASPGAPQLWNNDLGCEVYS